MRSLNRWVFVAVAVAMLCGVAGLIVGKRVGARDEALLAAKLAEVAQQQAKAAAPLAKAVRRDEARAALERAQASKAFKGSGQPKSKTPDASAGANSGGPSAKEPLKDPVARAALAWVGADPEAEAYWYGAINDPSLPPNERQNLIEDLNEDGLSDPKNPTADDLPLILSRMLLIEQVGSDAMDTVNADAFQEAYKDLVNLANLAMGGGEPFR
jgi:hypothetical protein